MLPKSIGELNEIREECYSLVTKRAGLSAGAAAIPVPGADIGTDVALLLEMIPAINRRFGLSEEQLNEIDSDVRRFILVTVTSIGSEMIGKLITKEAIVFLLKKAGVRVATKSVAKFIPLLGTAVAASVSYGLMRNVGRSHVDDCYNVARRAILFAEQKAAEKSAENAASEQAV